MSKGALKAEYRAAYGPGWFNSPALMASYRSGVSPQVKRHTRQDEWSIRPSDTRSEAWWHAARGSRGAPPAFRHMEEHGAATLTGKEMARFLRWAQRLPGWDVRARRGGYDIDEHPVDYRQKPPIWQ